MAINKVKYKKGTSYRVRIKRPDGSWATESFADMKSARAYELRLKQQKSVGALTSPSQVTLDEFFVSWFETIRNQATPGWRKFQQCMYRIYVKPALGSLKLSSINPPLIAVTLGRVTELGRSESMKLHVYVLLRKIFGDAVELFELLPKNPVIKKLRPRPPVKEAKYLSVQEIRKLLTHISGKPYELAIWLGVYMGLRVGELQALRWEDVDLERGVLHVRRTYSKHESKFREYPKGKRQHSHRIPPELLALLIRAKASARSELVAMPPLGRMLDYWIYRKALRRYCREAKITIISTHGLRHSTSELYMSHGASRDDLKLLFAHSSNSTTDRYVHDKGERLEKVAQVIQLFPRNEAGVDRKLTEFSDAAKAARKEEA